MSGTAVVVQSESLASPIGELEALRAAHNKLIDDVELLRSKYVATITKMDADAGITDTNYVALNTVLAASLTGNKVNLR
jgi:hypothetical protein